VSALDEREQPLELSVQALEVRLGGRGVIATAERDGAREQLLGLRARLGQRLVEALDDGAGDGVAALAQRSQPVDLTREALREALRPARAGAPLSEGERESCGESAEAEQSERHDDARGEAADEVAVAGLAGGVAGHGRRGGREPDPGRKTVEALLDGGFGAEWLEAAEWVELSGRELRLARPGVAAELPPHDERQQAQAKALIWAVRNHASELPFWPSKRQEARRRDKVSRRV